MIRNISILLFSLFLIIFAYQIFQNDEESFNDNDPSEIYEITEGKKDLIEKKSSSESGKG